MDLDLLVRADKLRLLYRQSFPAVFLSMIACLLLSALLWPVQEHGLLVGWVSILAASSLLRIALFIRYRRASPDSEQILKWQRPYFVTLMLSSLIWGVGALVVMPADSPVHQALVYYFIIGMSGGAVSVYSAHREMTLLAVLSVLLPVSLWMFSQGSYLTVGMGVGALLFLFGMVRATRVHSHTLQQNFTMTHQLEKARDEAEKLARMDMVSGLYNRRAFTEQAEICLDYCRRHDENLAMIIMDIDHFKQINDSHGHAAGDKALEHIGRHLRSHTRQSDICARLGGEEFGVLLMGTDIDKAKVVAEKLRSVIEETPIEFAGSTFRITASFGVASGYLDCQTLFRKADGAMYQAKDEGRNRVVADGALLDG